MARLHRIKYLIQARQCVPLQDFLDELEISRATFKRGLEYLRDRMNANIVYDRMMGGYRHDKNHQASKKFDYNHDPKLLMDILKYGSDEEVIASASPRKRIKDKPQKGITPYP